MDDKSDKRTNKSSKENKSFKKGYATFFRSIHILNRGIARLKPQNDPSSAFDVTKETYTKVVQELLDTLDDEKKKEIKR